MNSVKLSKSEAILLAKFACIKHRSLVPFYIFLCVGGRFPALQWALSGRSVRFMSRKELLKTSMYVRVFTYLKEHNYSAEAVEVIHQKYGLRNSRIRSIVNLGKRTEQSALKMLRDHVGVKP